MQPLRLETGVMTLATKIGDLDGPVQVGWWRCIKGQSTRGVGSVESWRTSDLTSQPGFRRILIIGRLTATVRWKVAVRFRT